MNIGTYDDAQPDGLSRNSQIGLMGFRTDYNIYNNTQLVCIVISVQRITHRQVSDSGFCLGYQHMPE